MHPEQIDHRTLVPCSYSLLFRHCVALLDHKRHKRHACMLQIRVEGLHTKAASVHIRCVLSGEAEGVSGHARCINGSADFDPNETVCLVVSQKVIAQVINNIRTSVFLCSQFVFIFDIFSSNSFAMYLSFAIGLFKALPL